MDIFLTNTGLLQLVILFIVFGGHNNPFFNWIIREENIEPIHEKENENEEQENGEH